MARRLQEVFGNGIAKSRVILQQCEGFGALVPNGSTGINRLHAALAYPIVVEGRNLYDPETMVAHGFLYYSVGRSDAQPQLRTIAVSSQ
jgi:hypothetical protein